MQVEISDLLLKVSVRMKEGEGKKKFLDVCKKGQYRKHEAILELHASNLFCLHIASLSLYAYTHIHIHAPRSAL